MIPSRSFGDGDALWTISLLWELSLHLGDLASIAGLLLTIGGFAITIAGVFSSRTAAQRAEAAARAAVLRLRVFEEVTSLSAAIAALDEIRRLHRLEQWTLLPDRYSSLRRTLILVKRSKLTSATRQRTAVQRALATLKTIEEAVEEGLSEVSSLDGARFNNLLSPHLDGLMSLLADLKAEFSD